MFLNCQVKLKMFFQMKKTLFLLFEKAVCKKNDFSTNNQTIVTEKFKQISLTK